MKGYYILFEKNPSVNIKNKIDAQMTEFKKYFDMEYIEAEPSFKSEQVAQIMSRVPLINIPRYDYKKLLEKLDNPGFLYFRKVSSDRNLIHFFTDVKEKFPECKILVELFTYPYYKDIYFRPYNFLLIPKDAYFSRRYKNLVDRLITYSNHDTIFGVKTIRTINGIDTDEFRAITPRTNDDEIHLLAVAMFRKHHGYERIFEGLKNYYATGERRVIRLFMVGEGPELDSYKKIVKEYGLEDNVIFLGVKKGEELEAIYSQSDIGLGSFGFYKIGLTLASSLKTREYLAKGLPFVAGCKQDVFPKGSSKYYLEFSNDSSPVDINEIVQFYDSLYSSGDSNRQKVVDQIRQFAMQTVSMDVAFKTIIEFIKS